VSARDESAVPVRPELPEPEPAAEQLDFLHRITLPELRREIEHHKDGKARWRKRAEAAEARVAELEAERHTTNEALSDAAEALRANRDRIAELEATRTGARSGDHSHPQTGDVTPQVQKLRALLAGQRSTQETDPRRRAAWRMLAEPEGEFHAYLHHPYRTGHDRPETGGVQ